MISDKRSMLGISNKLSKKVGPFLLILYNFPLFSHKAHFFQDHLEINKKMEIRKKGKKVANH